MQRYRCVKLKICLIFTTLHFDQQKAVGTWTLDSLGLHSGHMIYTVHRLVILCCLYRKNYHFTTFCENSSFWKLYTPDFFQKLCYSTLNPPPSTTLTCPQISTGIENTTTLLGNCSNIKSLCFFKT